MVLASDGLWYVLVQWERGSRDVVKSSEVGSWIAKWSQDVYCTVFSVRNSRRTRSPRSAIISFRLPSTETAMIIYPLFIKKELIEKCPLFTGMYITVMSILIHPFVPLSKEANSQSTEQKEDSEHFSSLRTFLLKHDRSTPNLDAYNVQSAIEEEEEVDVNSGVTIIENDQIINLKHRLAN